MPKGLSHFSREFKKRLSFLREGESEESVRSKVVIPVLTQGLGISIHDITLEESLQGVSSQGERGRADVVIRMAGRPALVVECKAPNRSLLWRQLRRAAMQQAERYATELEVDMVLFSNGYQWILTKGRSIVVEARDREEAVMRSREFFEWLKPENLWYSATGLVIPATFCRGWDLLLRCNALAVTPADIRALAHIREDMPSLAQRLEEEVKKALAIKEFHRFARRAPLQNSFSVVHLDGTFSGYRQGAWMYDPLYRFHLAEEVKLLRAAAKSGSRESSIRVFIVSGPKRSWAAHVYEVGSQMLSEHWIVAIIDQEDLARFELHQVDVVGDYVFRGFPHEDTDGGRFRRRPRETAYIREKLRDYCASYPDHCFKAMPKERYRFAENCTVWARVDSS